MDDVVASLVLLGIPVAFVWMVVRLSEGWMRKKIVERGADPELVDRLYERRESPGRYSALKWGMVTVGLGVGVAVEAVLPYDFEDPMAYGVLLLFGGLALILYYAWIDRGEGRVGPPGTPDPDRGFGDGASSREPPR